MVFSAVKKICVSLKIDAILRRQASLTCVGHCGYRSIKHVEGNVEEEEVSLILRGNWSLPTAHKGYTP